MLLGRVVGRVWSTAKSPAVEGQRLLIVQPVTPELKPTGKRLACADCTGAGAGVEEGGAWLDSSGFPSLSE